MKIEFTEKLSFLLKNKSFLALNGDEKKYVLTLISEEEYAIYAKFLNDTSELYSLEKDALKLPKYHLLELKKSFNKKHNSSFSKSLSVFNFQLPYYRPIAASLVGGIILFLVINFNQNISMSEEYYLSDDEFNKYTQFNEFYVELQVEDEVTNELINMEF